MNATPNEWQNWIDKADHDLGAAKLIYLHIPDYSDTIAFHCQQATEKYLKAILIAKNTSFVRTHDLIYLLEKISLITDISPELFEKALVLNGFSVEIRYPNTHIFLTNDDLKQSIEITDYFRNFAIDIISLV